MKIAILESIIMPAGHEVEFDRILVDELNNQGHEPVMLVPENFPFKIKYNAKVDYLEGGEVVTYAGANKFQKLWLSVKRESRRRKWFNSAYKKSIENNYDAIIIPTATYRYLRAILDVDAASSLPENSVHTRRGYFLHIQTSYHSLYNCKTPLPIQPTYAKPPENRRATQFHLPKQLHDVPFIRCD